MPDQAVEITDFSGGMTDNYVAGPLNKFQALQNFVIRPDKKAQNRSGMQLLDSVDYKLPGWPTRRGDSAYRFKDTNIFQQENKLYYLKAGSGYLQVTGPTGNSAMDSLSVQNDQFSYAEWNNHLLITSSRRDKPKYLFKDGVDLRLRNMGLPAVNISSITMGAAGSSSRVYYFCWRYSYSIDGVEFVMRSATSYVRFTGSVPNTLNNLPVLSNTAISSYDTTSVYLEIYRTINNGITAYKAGEVLNGVTTFADGTNDSNIINNIICYVSAGELDYNEPPKCKYLMQLNGCVYYANIEDSLADIYPNRVVISAPDQPYAANEDNIIDVDGDITAVGVAGQNAIIFTANKCYRVEGQYFSDGSGNPQKIELSRTVGCISSKSVVSTQEGCFFAAKDGFYFTDGYRVLRISEDINSTYANSTSTDLISKKIYGVHDPVNKRIYWSACSNAIQSEVNIIFVAHLYFGVSENTPFTVWDGGYWQTNFAPTSLLFYDSMLLSADKRGYLLKFADNQLNDAKIDVTKNPSQWTNYPVIYDLRSAATDFGSATLRKWVPSVVLYADSPSRAAIRIMCNTDNAGAFIQLAEVKANSPVLWGDTPVPLWGDSTLRWNYLPIISAKRRMPSPLRCSYKQLRVTNSYTEIDSSDVSGTVSVNSSTKQVLLNNLDYTWDAEIVDYVIRFSNDNYDRTYLILRRDSSTTLTVEDTSSTLPNTASTNFKINGYRKSESIRLLSLSMQYSMTQPTQTPPTDANE